MLHVNKVFGMYEAEVRSMNGQNIIARIGYNPIDDQYELVIRSKDYGDYIVAFLSKDELKQIYKFIEDKTDA